MDVERTDAVEGADRGQNRQGCRVIVMQDRRDRGRELCDAPGEHQVAEVDHAIQKSFVVRGSRSHQIVIRQVTVHDLHRQQRRHTLDAARLGPRHTRHPLAQVGVGDVLGEEVDHPGPPAQVPLQYPVRRRGRHVRQRGTHFATHTPHLRDGRRGEVSTPVERSTLEVPDEPHDVRPARRPEHSELADSRRSPQCRSGTRNPLGRAILVLDRLGVEGAVGDLHDGDRGSLRRIARARRVHEKEVRILLTAEVDGAHGEAERFFCPALRKVGRHEGSWQLPRLEEVEAGDAFACGHLSCRSIRDLNDRARRLGGRCGRSSR